MLTVAALVLLLGTFMPLRAFAEGAVLPAPAVAFENPGASVADYLACLRAADIMLVSGHRGGPVPGFPENALETFANTLAHGPMLIETDVRMTRDGVLILLHDETLERTTTGSGLVADAPWAEIKALSLVDDEGEVTAFRVPTLTEALAWARGRAILQLDVKSGAPIDKVAAAVSAAGAHGFAAVIAYTVQDAVRAAAVDPHLTLSVEILDRQSLDDLIGAGLDAARLMAWTGIETERPALWAGLNGRGISAAWGSLWYLDEEVRRSGDRSAFVRLAKGQLDVLSSDLHIDAYNAAETVQDTTRAVKGCNDKGL
ncbi:MAG: glycerophosphodiester phosphodiesterase family protein [Pseudomonadota bacterium]